MKKKLSFIALFAILVINTLLFSGCDFLFGNDDPNDGKPNNGNGGNGGNGGNAPCAHTWEWVITTPPPDEGEDAVEKDSIATQRCKKCETTGRTVTIPAGSDVNEILSEFEEDASENDDGNVNFDISDDELESILSSTGTNPDAIVGPLITTKWAQRYPFNNLFPLAPGNAKADSNGVLITGCGYTAMVQIMSYHKHPIRGSGQGTSIKGFTVPFVDLSSVAYDWDNMLDHYRSDGKNSTPQQRNAVAVLFQHYGIALGITDKSEPSLIANFGYDRSLQQLYRKYYTDAEWEAIIKQQLDLKLPVYYWGTGDGSSHAFVIDGYDSQGRFHINWGWRGASDGWYSINNLNPPSMGRKCFYNDQHIIINIKPDQGSTGSNVFALNNFTVNGGTTAVQTVQNEMPTVNIKVRSFGIFPGGQRGAALVDNGGNIVSVIRSEKFDPLGITSTRTSTMRFIVPNTAPTGDYRLMIVTRMEGGQWKLVTASDKAAGIPNAIPITITAETGTPGGGYGLSLREFSTDKTSVGRNEMFTVTVNHRNRGEGQFPGGTIGVVLVDNDGYIVGEPLGTRSRGTLSSGSRWTSPVTINCIIPYYGIDPGNYRLRIAVKTATGDWRICSLAEEDIPTSINFTVISGVRSPFLDFFNDVAAYRTATNNIEVIVNQNLTISQLVSIPAPAATGATLTIRSANPSQPVTLTRGVSGNLFTVTNGATLIFRDIIIDGGNGGDFVESGGGTLVRVNSSSFVMNDGAVLCNNTNTTTTHPGGGVFTSANSSFTMNGGVISGNNSTSGGGVYIYNTCTFTMTGGEISGNTANSNGGGVYTTSTFNITVGEINGNKAAFGGGVFTSGSAIFTMNGGKIRGNTTTSSGGGVYINGTNPFIMTDGEISGNTASSGNGVRIASSAIFDQNGGVVAGTGANLTAVINGTHNLNTASPNNGVTIVWNRPSGTLNYTVGTSTDLTVSAGATATWANQSGVLGISYANGANVGWIRQW